MNPNQQHAQQRNKHLLQMQPTKQVRDEDEFTRSYVAMLNVMRRIYDLGGDAGIKTIIEKAERALAHSR